MKDAPHWNWSHGFCEKHRGQELPCALCIAAGDFVDDGVKKETPEDPETGTVFFSLTASQRFGFNYYRLLSGEIVRGTNWSTAMSDGQDYHWPDKIYLGVGTFDKLGSSRICFANSFYTWFPVNSEGHFIDGSD